MLLPVTDPVLPPSLQPGDRVALVAPAGPVHAALLAQGCELLRSWGLEPVEMAHTRAVRGFLAGTDDQRLADLEAAWKDPEMAGIFCIRGGYGCQRLVDRLDWRLVAANPKVLVGYSDVTALHLAVLARTGQVSFHGPNLEWSPGRLGPQDEAALRRAVMAAGPLGTLPVRARTLVGGVVRGRLVGGNLSLLATTLGTSDAAVLDGGVLLVEEVGERPYRIDRMLTQLRRAGVLGRAAGLVFGQFPRCGETSPGTAPAAVDEVISEHAGRAGIPAVADLPVGHGQGQLTLPHGAPVVLDADAGTLTFPEPATSAQPP